MWKILSGEKTKLNKGREQVINKFSINKFSANFMDGIREVLGHRKKM